MVVEMSAKWGITDFNTLYHQTHSFTLIIRGFNFDKSLVDLLASITANTVLIPKVSDIKLAWLMNRTYSFVDIYTVFVWTQKYILAFPLRNLRTNCNDNRKNFFQLQIERRHYGLGMYSHEQKFRRHFLLSLYMTVCVQQTVLCHGFLFMPLILYCEWWTKKRKCVNITSNIYFDEVSGNFLCSWLNLTSVSALGHALVISIIFSASMILFLDAYIIYVYSRCLMLSHLIHVSYYWHEKSQDHLVLLWFLHG